MEVLRIKLRQSQANYKKEETVLNKSTYPLPPLSTIIGAIHNACDFKDYQPMDISVQGIYESLHREPYTDYCFLNNSVRDRGMLVRFNNQNLLSKSFIKVAKAIESKDNKYKKEKNECEGKDFKTDIFFNGKDIVIHNEKLLEEYRHIRLSQKRISNTKQNLSLRLEKLLNKKKMLNGNVVKIKFINDRIKQLKSLKERLKIYETENCNKPYSKFASLTTSIKYYEILTDIELIIHIKSDENTLQAIEENIYNLKAIGRSEDFVDIIEIKRVTLHQNIDDEYEGKYSAYIDYELVKNNIVLTRNKNKGVEANGTKYHINKNYIIENNKRIFEKKKVVYMSGYCIDECGKNLYLDTDGNETYIVNLI